MAKLLRWLHWHVVLLFLVPRVWQPVVAQYPPLVLLLFQNAQISSCRDSGFSPCGQAGTVGEVSPFLGLGLALGLRRAAFPLISIY